MILSGFTQYVILSTLSRSCKQSYIDTQSNSILFGTLNPPNCFWVSYGFTWIYVVKKFACFEKAILISMLMELRTEAL